MTRGWLAGGLILALLPLGAGEAAERTFDRTFPTEPGSKLTIQAENGGEIDISTWEKNEIRVLVTDRKGNYKVDFEPEGKNLRVHGEYEGPERRNITTDVTFEVQVPARFDLDLESQGGGISISGVEGRIEGRTMGGELRLEKTSGEVDLKTMGGGIEVVGNRAAAHLETMGGNVEVDAAPAGLYVQTMGGDVKIDRAAGNVEASTMGGRISIELIEGAGDCEASTQGGDITLHVPRGYSARFEVSAMDAESDVEGLRLRRNSEFGPAIFRGTLGDGDHEVELSTMGGTVRIVEGD